MESPVQTVRCEADGFEFEAPVGASLMLALKGTGFEIEASCEGSLACGTCHVRVLGEWASRLPPPAEDERAMLTCLPNVTDRSRLSCQIVVVPQIAGLSLEIPR